MTTYLRDRLPNLIAAAATFALGLFAYLESSGYDMGELRAMEAGYFPRMISFGLLGLGALQAGTTLIGPPHGFSGDKISIFSVAIISASLLSFAMMIERFGMIPAIFVSVLLSTFASEKRNYTQAILLSAGTALISTLVFITILGLPIKVFAL